MCDQCEFSSKSHRGLKVHMERRHKDLQLPENLCDESHKESLNLSLQSEDRDEDVSLVNADNSSTCLLILCHPFLLSSCIYIYTFLGKVPKRKQIFTKRLILLFICPPWYSSEWHLNESCPPHFI